MNYTNLSNRLRLPGDQVSANPAATTILSLESGKNGTCLRVRKAATAARRKIAAFKLAAAALAFGVVPLASAQLGYDPFAGNSAHTEEKWAPYTDASTGGTNRPNSTAVNGVSTPASATAFNFGVTTATADPAFLTSGGNIYSPTSTLTLTLSSTYTPAAFNTVVFSIKTLGNALNTGGVLLTLASGTTVAPRFTSVTNSGTGMGASAQSAFQWDLSSLGGANNFTITVPGSAPSVSFSSAQLDTTTTSYGAQSVVPEPSTNATLAAGGLSLLWLGQRLRRRSALS